MATQNDFAESVDLEPMESPQTELARVIEEGDPDSQLHILERKAKLARRMQSAINHILVSCTYPEDWIQHGETMCLKSAAAERIARNFDIRFANCKSRKEEIKDGEGTGYRYIYEGEASMNNRVVFCQGVYSTRDQFLGKKGGEWRPIEEINENHIRSAAYHIMIGNGIKALLGLRGIPVSRFDEIMASQGEDAKKSSKVEYAQGTKGGSSADDTAQQKELGELLIEMANALVCIKVEGDGTYNLDDDVSEASDPIDVAKLSCKCLTTFYSKKDKKLVAGIDSVKKLKGKRLEIALKNAKEMWANYEKEHTD